MWCSSYKHRSTASARSRPILSLTGLAPVLSVWPSIEIRTFLGPCFRVSNQRGQFLLRGIGEVRGLKAERHVVFVENHFVDYPSAGPVDRLSLCLYTLPRLAASLAA